MKYYAIRKVQKNQVGLKLNGTHQLLAYADDVNLLGDNIDTIEKNTETLIDASRDVGLEINVEKSKYLLLSRNQNAGQNLDIIIANRSFENVSQFRYLGTTVTNENLIQEEIEFWQCLQPFGQEPPVFSVAVEKLKNYNIQDYNFVCGSVWV
jgi:hypothetical protein